MDAEMLAFQSWADDTCGVAFKYIKDRVAAQVQLALGFWWDSRTLTRALEDRKMVQYLGMLADYATRPKLTLREMQSAAGRMQRCIMTFPPGAGWMLAPLFAMMCGLRLPWHMRRTTRAVRDNFAYCGGMLRAALGRGYYSFANFARAPPVWTDASKSNGYAGGGFVSACGRYDFWSYGSRAARKLIDFLEGDTVVAMCERMAHLWKGCIVAIYCDNRAFKDSGAKGRSRTERLNDLIKELFLLMIRFEFVIEWYWISSEDNLNSDHLSRNRESKFLTTVYESGCWSPDVAPQRLDGAGRVRVLPEKRGLIATESKSASEPPAPQLRADAPPFVPATPPADDASDYIKRAQAAGSCTYRAPPRRGGALMLVLALIGCFCVPEGAGMPVSRIQASLQYPQRSVFDGLPAELQAPLDMVLDNRLAPSSMRTVNAGLRIWTEVATMHGWNRVITSSDPAAGGKMAAFVLHMLQDTELVWSSIQSYVWGLRTWNMLQHQTDPIMGLHDWENFMKGVKVLTWVAAEPRRRTPIEVLGRILDAVDLSCFWEVQLAFLLLCLLYTFSRSECPCPKTFTGRESFDKEVHWNVLDFDMAHVAGRRVLRVRFRVIKQDPRIERPEASGDGDWVIIGEVPGGSKFCPVAWFLRLQRFHGTRPNKRGPMFVDPDMVRPLLYSKLRAQFSAMQRRVGVPEDELTGPHGLRVGGYNRTKNALGEAVAVVQGGWKSSAHKRYDRFAMATIVRIPAVIAGVDAGEDAAPSNEAAERTLHVPRRRLRRSDVQPPRPKAVADGSEPESINGSDADDESELVADDGSESGPSGAAGAAPAASSGAGPVEHRSGRGWSSAVRPAGYWGSTPIRPSRGARQRAQSPRSRRSPSQSSRD